MQKVFPIPADEAEFLPLSVVPNGQGTPKNVQIIDPEFSSVCPKTGLPDYGRVILRYIPDEHCVELKDWKLFLRCFYGVGSFHEDCTQRIADAFAKAVNPKSFTVVIDWGARGGLHTTTQLCWVQGEGYVPAEMDELFNQHALTWNNR